jgi:hypothetical protein
LMPVVCKCNGCSDCNKKHFFVIQNLLYLNCQNNLLVAFHRRKATQKAHLKPVRLVWALCSTFKWHKAKGLCCCLLRGRHIPKRRCLKSSDDFPSYIQHSPFDATRSLCKHL